MGHSSPTPLARQLAAKWGKVFGVPAAMILTIMDMESDFVLDHPPNMDAKSGGGAWGGMQILLTTAAEQGNKLRESKLAQDPTVKATLSKWHAIPSELMDPDINTMLGTYYMSNIMKNYGFKTMDKLAAAYNQGPGALKKHLADGGSMANYDLAYVEPALAAYRRYA